MFSKVDKNTVDEFFDGLIEKIDTLTELSTGTQKAIVSKVNDFYGQYFKGNRTSIDPQITEYYNQRIDALWIKLRQLAINLEVPEKKIGSLKMVNNSKVTYNRTELTFLKQRKEEEQKIREKPLGGEFIQYRGNNSTEEYSGKVLRVVIDLDSIGDGLGSSMATLKLINQIRKQNKDIKIEVMLNAGYIYAQSSNTENAELPVTSLPRFQRGEKGLNMLPKDINQKLDTVFDKLLKVCAEDDNIRIMTAGEVHAIMNSEQPTPNVIAMTGAFDPHPGASSLLFKSSFGAEEFVCLQHIGWKLSGSPTPGTYKDGKLQKDFKLLLPPLNFPPPSLESSVQQETESSQRSIILYKTFQKKNDLEEESFKVLERLNADAKKKGSEHKYTVRIYSDTAEDAEDLERRLRDLSLENLSIIHIPAGKESHQEYTENLKKASLVITEGQNTAWEAMQLGTPVIHAPLTQQAISVHTLMQNQLEGNVTPISDIESNAFRGAKFNTQQGFDFDGMKQEALNMQKIIYKQAEEKPTVDKELGQVIELAKPKQTQKNTLFL